MSVFYRRQRGPFDIVDTADTAKNGFWQSWASEEWEPMALAVLEAHCVSRGPEARIFDVGAWVGPYTLLAADYGCEVISLEPDPVAYAGLVETLARNVELARYVIPLRKAVVGPTTWFGVELRRRGSWGDSMSSINREPVPPKDASEYPDDISAMQVAAVSLQRLCEIYGPPTLIKMDIEGGEANVLPFAGPFLRGIPGLQLLLSLHPDWYGAELDAMRLQAELQNWKLEHVEKGHGEGWDTWLCRAAS